MCTMKSPRSIVALLTDFGTRDPYVAAMKGVVASRCHAELLDLSHEITSFDSFEAGWFLRMAGPTFLPGSDFIERVVIVAVVDPGVGTARRILAALDRGCFYLAPDNGLLSVALSPRATFVVVENDSLFLPEASTTFHGRDRFAPVAAALAEGVVGIDDLGPVIERSEIVTLDYREPVSHPSGVTGTVVAIDRFGNVITDIEPPEAGQPITIFLGDHVINELRQTYGGGSGQEPFAIVGSRGTIELSLNQGSAAERLQSERLDEVRLEWVKRER